jgi:hypothetical protein
VQALCTDIGQAHAVQDYVRVSCHCGLVM